MRRFCMENAFKFLLIFGVALLLAAASLAFSKDPRNSIFFARVHGKPSKEEAKKTARTIAGCVAGVGAAIIIYCLIGLISGS